MGIEDSAEGPMSRLELAAFLFRMYESVQSEPEKWTNDTLELFLRGWSAWLNGMEESFRSKGEEVPDEPSWELIARMVLEARAYQWHRVPGEE